MADLEFGIRLTADGNAFVGTVRVARQEVENLGKAASGTAAKGVQDLDRSMKQSMTSAVALGSAIGNMAAEAITAIAKWSVAGVKTAAELKNMADATGSSVESLSALRNSFAISGNSAADLSTALQRLSVGLSGADAEAKESGKALALLGIQSRDPATALVELAKKLDMYADGANKAALVQAILGRGAQNLLPALKDLAEQQTIHATVTRESAAAAEQLEKDLRRMAEGSGALRDALLKDLVPALAAWSNGIAAARQAGLGWWDSLEVGTTYADRVGPSIEMYTKKVADLQDAIDRYRKAGDEGHAKMWERDLEAAKKYLSVLNAMDLNAMVARGWGMGDRGAGKPTPPKPKTTEIDAAARAIDQFRKMAAEAQVDVEALLNFDQATHAEKALAALMASTDWTKKFTAAEQVQIMVEADAATQAEKHVAAVRREQEIERDAAKAVDDRNKLEQDRIDAARKVVESIEDGNQKLKDEISVLGLSNTERERRLTLLEKERAMNAATSDIERRRIEQLYDERLALIDAKGATEQYIDAQHRMAEMLQTLDDYGRSFFESFADGMKGVKDWAKSAGDAIKRFLLDVLYALVKQQFMIAIGLNVTGGVGGSAASMLGGASGGFGGNMLGSAASSLFGGATLGVSGGAAGTFAVSSMGEALGLSVAMGGGEGAVLTSLGTAFTGFAAAMPYVAAAIAIGMLVKSYLDSKRGGPKTGGFATTGGVDLSGTQTFDGRWMTPSDADSVAKDYVTKLSTGFADTLRALGGTSGTAGFALGFDMDPQGKAQSQIHSGVWMGGKQVYDYQTSSAGRSQEELTAALETESRRMILAALQASELPREIAGVLNTLTASTATSEQIDNAIAFASAMKNVIDAIGGDVVKDATQAFEDSQRSVTSKLRDMGKNVTDLAGKMDGSLASMQALASATVAYRQAAAQAVVAIRQLQASLKEMFASTREQVEFAGLTKQASYDLYQQKGSTLFEMALGTDNPALVEKYAGKINDYFLAAFNLLSPEEQLAHKQEFLDSLDSVDTQINKHLGDIADQIGTDTTGPFAEAQKALDGAAEKFDAAAGVQKTAADQMTAAADKMMDAAEKIDGATINVQVGGYAPAVGG